MTADPGANNAADALLGAYRAGLGASDELIDGTGAPRSVWRRFIGHLPRLDANDVAARFERANGYLRDARAFYRK